MRPYRAKRKDNREWVYGWYLNKHESDWDGHDVYRDMIHTGEWNEFVDVDPATVGQSLGHKAKNGDVYDGDFIKKCGEQPIMGPSYVHFNKHTACWGLVAWNHNFTPFYRYCVHDSTDSGGVVHSKMLDWENYEIIGNVHEEAKE